MTIMGSVGEHVDYSFRCASIMNKTSDIVIVNDFPVQVYVYMKNRVNHYINTNSHCLVVLQLSWDPVVLLQSLQ